MYCTFDYRAERLSLYISVNAYPHFIQNIPFDRNRIVCGNLIIIEPVRGTQLYIQYFIMYILVKGTKNTDNLRVRS
jgi:hypothetical protein